MRSEKKLVIPGFAKSSWIAVVLVTVALVGFAAVLFLGAFKKGADVGAHFFSGALILGIWFIVTVGFIKNYGYLHIRYSCTVEGITNSVRNDDRALPVTTGVFCTCIPVKFYLRYGYVMQKLYLFSENPFDWDLTEYAGGNFIKKVWKDQMFLMPVCADTTDWIQSTYGCENLAEYPKVAYLPPKG